MTAFAQRMVDSFPAGMKVPDPIRQLFEWVEAQGLARVGGRNQDYHYGLLDPALDKSSVHLVPVDPDHWGAWVDRRDDPDLATRAAPFCRTGGDGSYAALWTDDDGHQRIVHLGSGSGSTMIGVLADDPVDFLRLLAIGYDELCWPDLHDRTPRDLYEERRQELTDDGWDDDLTELGEFREPDTLRRWVTGTFAVTIPQTASELITNPADMGQTEPSDDPFWRWVRANVWE